MYSWLDPNTDFYHLEISTRAYNCVRSADIRTLSELRALSDRQLLSIPCLGKVTLAELRELQTRDADVAASRAKHS
jgi:DNA-directed RNA polymerase alpha subunit